MKRSKKLIIAILLVILIGLFAIIAGVMLSGPALTEESKNVLVLASDRGEQQNGAVDMAFMVHLENGKITNYTPVYPGGMTHPSQPEPVPGVGGRMLLHACLWNGVKPGMQYASEIVEANTKMHADAVVLVYTDGIDAVIKSISPLKVNGQDTNLSAEDIIRENDAYSGYPGNENVQGTMSRGDAVMVLVNALADAAQDPSKKSTMVQTALDQYSKGNIIMTPEGSFTRLLATKGFESIGK